MPHCTRPSRFLVHCALAFGWLPIALGADLSVFDLQPEDVLITEYMADPIGVSDAQGEYFEIFNTLNASIDLADLVVRDDGSNSFTVSSLTLAPHGFAVLGTTDGSALGHVTDYIYGGSMSLTNTDDEIALFRPDDVLLHKITWNDGDFFGDGIAHELADVALASGALSTGPALGADFVAAGNALLLGNLGSPGAAGGTNIATAVLPVPAATWLFGSGLVLLTTLRRRACRADC